MSKSNYDQLLSIFSPEGSLYQVEYSYKAVKAAGITSVAIRAKDGVVVVSQRKVPDKLIKPESVTNVFNVDGRIGAAVIGRVPDGRLVLDWARDKAYKYKYDCGHPIGAQLLAKRLAGMAQYNTQTAQHRAMGVSVTLFSIENDDKKGGALAPQLFKVDPSGHFVGYFAVASGAKEVEAQQQLEKATKAQGPFGDMSLQQASDVALATLQHVCGEALKGKDVEMACVSAERPEYHVIGADQIDAMLTAIAERD